MFMVPIARHPSELFKGFEHFFDDGFERFFAPLAQPEALTRTPALDLSETEREYTVKLDMPGVTKDDIKVSVEGRRVSIEAQTQKTDEKKEGDRVVYRERSMASFARSFTLAGEVDAAETTAKLENGVLVLTLPKRGGAASARIAVR